MISIGAFLLMVATILCDCVIAICKVAERFGDMPVKIEAVRLTLHIRRAYVESLKCPHGVQRND
jgi:hypothetical protein